MRTLLLASVVIVLAATAAPHFITSYMQAPDALPYAGSPVKALQEDASERSGASRMTFRAERDGHFYVDAEIDGANIKLLVDTGATMVALTEKDAADAGFRPPRAAFKHPVTTANGVSYAAEAHLREIVIGEIVVDDISALVLPDEALSVSLLGGSFLSRLARYQVEGASLIFEN